MMAKLEMLNTLVNERLSIAAKEINGMAARIIWEVENQYKADLTRLQKENERQRKLLDALLKPAVRVERAEIVNPPVYSEEEVCLDKKRGILCPDQADDELPQNCGRQEDLGEVSGSKLTLMVTESKENTPPIQGDIHSDEEDECEIARDTSATVKEETYTHVRVLKSCLEPQKDTGHSHGDDEHLSTQRASIKSRKHPPRRVSQKQKVTRRVKKHGSPSKKLKSCEEPPKDSVTPVEGKKSPVKISQRKPLTKRKSSIGLSGLSCKVCNTSFLNEADLIKHVDVHSDDCGLCGHHLEHTENFKSHLEEHKTCDVCGKKCKTLISLAKHMKIHTGGKSLTCTICCKTFREKNLLWSHSRTHKTERPYSCTVCGKSFRHSSTLDRHNLLHTGEKPHTCNICGKRFRQKNHVSIHMATHTGDKPFSCVVCDKRFRQKTTMKKHMSLHTKLKLYECLVCGKKLSREDSMRRHRKLHERGDK